MENKNFTVKIAGEDDISFIPEILEEIENSAKERGTGIARRNEEYIAQKMQEGKAIIAFAEDGEWAGFCYIETWSNKEYVANSGLIVKKKFRKDGLAKKIKEKTFKHSRESFPDAKIFGLTTGLAVMKINSDLGYEPVTFSELTQDDVFWNGCKSCVNYDILMAKDRKNCLCTAMLFDPKEHTSPKTPAAKPQVDSKFKKIKALIWKK